MHGDREKGHEHRLSLPTLIIGSVSSAAAAVIVHEIWRAGSILGAAVTPVLMTLFAEALRRPVERVTVRMPVGQAPLSDPPMPDATIRVYRSLPRWRLAVVTGLTAFVLGAAALTAAEVLLQRSVADGHAGTTLFDTRPRHGAATPTEAEPPSAPREPDRTPTPTPTPTPSPTPTATATSTPGPSPTPTPAPATPAPPQPTPSPGTGSGGSAPG
jgi:hypothetical protein